MKRKQSKNYTLYWMSGISALLTIPIALIILKKVQAGNLVKSVMILAVFLLLLIAIMVLYKNIFGVSVQEITHEEKVTELDRLSFQLEDERKKHSNLLLRKCMDRVLEQIQRFKRRKNVMLELAGTDTSDQGALGDLVKTVEDALSANIDRLVNRVEIFDDQGVPDTIRRNIEFIEEQIHKNEEILTEFETLITETSRMGETREDKDISKLWDVVNAMKSLRKTEDDNLDELAKKYDKN